MALGQPTPLREERTTDEHDFGRWTAPVLTLALQALEERVLLWITTLGAGAIWLFAVTHPDWLRIIAASLYSCTVLWPFLLLKRRGG